MSVIRKLIAAVLITALCAAGLSLAEEKPEITAHDYLGEWVDQDGTTNIDITGRPEGDGYIAEVELTVIEGESLSYLVWAYGCVYDEETRTLRSFSRFTGAGDYEPDSEEEITGEDWEYAGAAFCFNEQGELVWSDENETVDDGMVFSHTIGWKDPDYVGPGHHFDGVWTAEGLTVLIYEGMDCYAVIVSGDDEDGPIWMYTCAYDAETDSLVSDGELAAKLDLLTNPEGFVYEDGGAVFSLDAEGCLIWQDAKENAGEGLRFVRMEEGGALPFATIGEAMDSEAYAGMAGGYDDAFIAVVEQDGRLVRLVAGLDEEGLRLRDAIQDAGDIEAAFDAYNAHVRTLPVTYAEELTAEPKTREELDALAGKTLLELEEEGFEIDMIGTQNEACEVTCTVSCGLYNYELVLNESFEVYQAHEESGEYGDLTVRSAAFAGPSRCTVDLSWLPDGTQKEADDAWAVYNELMELIADALASEDPAAAINALAEKMPDKAEEIAFLAQIRAAISGAEQP